MTTSFDAPGGATLCERGATLARRLLSGGGAAAVCAYRLGQSVGFAAHGLTADGALVLAVPATGALGDLTAGEVTDVRVDVVRQSCDPAVPIVAASVHLLGVLRFVDPAGTRERVASGSLPETVAALLDLPDMRLCAVEVERIVLHDLEGAAVIDPDVLRAGPAVTLDDLDSFSRVAGRGQEALRDLAWGVMVAAVDGVVVRRGASRGCAAAGRAYCVDVDEQGVTLLLAEDAGTAVVFAGFPAHAGSREAQAGAIDALFEASRARVVA